MQRLYNKLAFFYNKLCKQLTLCILMDFSIYFDIAHFVFNNLKGSQVEVSKYEIFLFLKVVLILAANSAAAFHLGLHCLSMSTRLGVSSI